jgi:hypothetical protein
MMIQYSALQAKREEMARESDPQSDLEEESERFQRDEAEVRREMDEVETNQRGSISRRLQQEHPNKFGKGL